MKKIINIVLVGLLIGLSFSSCLNNNNDEEYQKYLEEIHQHQQKILAQYLVDSTLIVDYLLENDSMAVFDEDYNFFYNIIESGADKHPTENSSITIKYKGFLLDGTVFDETTGDETASFYLSTLISGWKLGLPLIGEGGKIILYLPSYYGYGDVEKKDIPANSVLVFDIDLIEFY